MFRSLCCGVLAAALFAAPAASAAIHIDVSGPGVPVHAVKCQSADVPDAPARAFVDASGNVQFTAGSVEMYRSYGPNLSDLTRDCSTRIFTSHEDPVPRNYNDLEWLASPYTLDGTHVYSLVHNEYHGDRHNNCAFNNYFQTGITDWRCWWNAITLATSSDGGAHYSHTTAPSHEIASSPIDFDPNATNFRGLFEPSNIIARNGYYYAFALSLRNQSPENPGSCVMRTQNLSDPRSWRFWNGSSFALGGDRLNCLPVIPYTANGTNIGMAVSWNTYLGAYIAVGCYQAVCEYSTSPDLIIWTLKDRFAPAAGQPAWSGCSGYPSLIQPGDPTRNFEQTGRSPWLYYVSDTSNTVCNSGLTQTLYRSRIRFSRSGDENNKEYLDLQANESRGQKTLDSSFYTNDGSLAGDAALRQEGTDNFLRFSGAGSVTVPNSSSLSVTGIERIDARLRITSLPSKSRTATIVRKEDSGRTNYRIRLTSKGTLRFGLTQGAGVAEATSQHRLNTNAWHSVSVLYQDATGQAVWTVDGQAEAPVTLGASLASGANTGPVVLGDAGYRGDIDSLTISNR